MPTITHELPLRFLDDRPDIALDFATSGGLSLPQHAKLALTSGDMSRTASVTERRVDRVVLLYDEADHTVGVLLVEVQCRKDEEARGRWPGKLAEAAERHHCDAYLLVVCPDPDVALWAAEPVHIGNPGISGLSLRALAVPPHAIPKVDDVDRVPDNPELSVLSALAHGKERDSTVLSTVVDAFSKLLEDPPPDNGNLNYSPQQYVNFLYDAGSDIIRHRLENLMSATSGEYIRYSIPFLRDAQDRAYSEAYSEAYDKAYNKAYNKAYDEAYDKASIEHARKILLELLELRRVPTDSDQRLRVNECTDPDQLDTWFRRAATADKATEVFDPS